MGDHGYSGPTTLIDMALYWSNADGSAEVQAWENNTQRLMPEAWRTNADGDEYKPGTRLTLVVDLSALDENAGVGMVLLTSSAGKFEDVGMHEDHASATALKCNGQRLNPSLMSNKHKIMWLAPDSSVGSVTLRVTTASGMRGKFYQSTKLVNANSALLTPNDPARNSTENVTEPTHDHDTLIGDSRKKKSNASTAFAVHGAMMFAGIWMCMPGAVAWSRFGRPRLNDKPSAVWFTWHKYLMLTAVTLITIAAIIAFAGVADLGATHYDCPHSKLGLVLLLVVLLQPINGYLRPSNPPEGEPKQPKRTYWEYAHKITGYLILFLGFIAVLTGIAQLARRDDSVPARYQAGLFVAYVLVLLTVTAHHTYRLRRVAAPSTERERFIELTSMR
jgi:hypothetical protein